MRVVETRKIWVGSLAAKAADCKSVTLETALVRVQPCPLYWRGNPFGNLSEDGGPEGFLICVEIWEIREKFRKSLQTRRGKYVKMKIGN